MVLVEQSKPLTELDPAAYDAIFLVGGQAPMVTFVDEPRVHEIVRAFYVAGKVTSIVCHATSVLLKAKLSDGSLLVSGKTWTGFADSEEDFADAFVGQTAVTRRQTCTRRFLLRIGNAVCGTSVLRTTPPETPTARSADKSTA